MYPESYPHKTHFKDILREQIHIDIFQANKNGEKLLLKTSPRHILKLSKSSRISKACDLREENGSNLRCRMD